MFSKFPIAIISCLLLLTCGCSNDVKKLKSNVNRLERNLADLRSIQAEHTSVVSDVRAELRRLTGRLDELEYSQNKLSRAGSEMRGLEPRIAPPEVVPSAILSVDEVYVNRLSPDVSAPFGAGLKQLRSGNFGRALESLNDALALTAGKEVSALVLFWVGIAHEGLQEPREALAAYHEASSNYSRHRRTPLVLLRQGKVFNSLGDRESAKLTYQKLVTDYPRSNEAATARQRLKTL